MKDFTLTCYNNKLWIKDLLSLQFENGKFYHFLGNDRRPCEIRFTSVFGTIVEIKEVKENCALIVVDDGTGSIGCRYSTPELLQQLHDWSWKMPTLSDGTKVDNTMQNTSSFYDTVFNDMTVQKDDLRLEEDSRTKALESLRSNLVKSFSPHEAFNRGDIVCVHGKLYSYFQTPQIYINVIRHMEMDEELVLTMAKLDVKKDSDGTETTEVPKQNTPDVYYPKKKQKVSNDNTLLCNPATTSDVKTPLRPRRRSGLMTFDTLGESDRLSIAPISSPAVQNSISSGSYVPPANVLYATYDTLFSLEEETCVTSDSDDDDFIPSTPPNKFIQMKLKSEFSE